MISGAARVAPEKAVFRPALPMSFMPGISEMQMSKTYAEKFKDPRWQKLRLEALQAANWTCSLCGDTETTLHVHHRQYFKGHEPWEYQVGQLEVLCETCHEAEHDSQDKLLLACSFVQLNGPTGRPSVASLVAGYCGMPMTNELVDDPGAYLIGQLAAAMEPRLNFNTVVDLRAGLVARRRHIGEAAVRAAIEALKTMPETPAPTGGPDL